MANLADFELKAKGSKKSFLTFKEILECETQDKKHLFVHQCNYAEIENDYLVANGICKWSAWSGLFKGESTYYDRFHNELPTLCNIQDLAKELKLEIEIFGNEMGCDFAEYYLINNNGEIIKKFEVSNLLINAIKTIVTKFNLDEKEINKFINEQENLSEERVEFFTEIYDDDIDDYVFDECGIRYPAYYAKFDYDSIKYGEFTI